MKKKLVLLSSVVLGLVPAFALAQVSNTGSNSTCDATLASGGTLFTLLCKFGTLLNAIVPVLIALGVVYFVWGVITYVVSNDEEAKKAGRDRIIFGIIGLAVIIGVWGLVNLLRNTFGLNNNQQIQIPTVPVVIP
jgi:predicted membrane channel-forming protein YqfA (hemolysin III family)